MDFGCNVIDGPRQMRSTSKGEIVMVKRRNVLAVAAAMLAASIMPAFAEKVVMATEASFPPFSKTEADGSFTGFEIDLGNEVCKRAGFECTWVKQDFDGAIAALNASKFDVIFSSMSIKPERAKVADFSIAYYDGPSAVFAKKGAISAIPAGLDGKSVGVYAGATQDGFARTNFAGATVRGYENVDQITADLRAGRIDAMFIEQLAGMEFLGKPEGAEFEMLQPSFSDKSLGAGVGAMTRKGDARMAKINEALKAIYADGTFDTISAKWLPAGASIRADKLW
jgi:lysine-arginine-ornithine-binding protein